MFNFSARVVSDASFSAKLLRILREVSEVIVSASFFVFGSLRSTKRKWFSDIYSSAVFMKNVRESYSSPVSLVMMIL